MIKNNVQIKKSISIIDRIDMTKYLVSGYFVNGEYTPYYKEINDIVAFFTYCVDGIEFEIKENENGEKTTESIYNAVINDKELIELWKKRTINCSSTFKSQLEVIYADVKDMVEFEKQRLILTSNSIEKKILEILDKDSRNKDIALQVAVETERLQKAQRKQIEQANKITELMTPEEMAELNRLILKKNDYDPNEIAKNFLDKYLESDRHNQNMESVIETKNNKIKELEVYKKMHDARNVLSQ